MFTAITTPKAVYLKIQLKSFGNIKETITDIQSTKGFAGRWKFSVKITLLNRESVLTRNNKRIP